MVSRPTGGATSRGARLLAELTSHLAAPARQGAPWVLCLTGTSVAGKSAVFAEMLVGPSAMSALVLAHAAGAMPHGASVDDDMEPVLERFASLLGRAA